MNMQACSWLHEHLMTYLNCIHQLFVIVILVCDNFDVCDLEVVWVLVFCYWCFCVEVGGLFVLVFWYWDLVISFNLAQAQAMAGIPHHIFQECRQRGSSRQRGRPRSPSPLRRTRVLELPKGKLLEGTESRHGKTALRNCIVPSCLCQ